MLRLQLHHVYILEAHPVDGWVDADNVSEGVCLRQAKTFDQRVAAAEALVRIRLRQTLTHIVNSSNILWDFLSGKRWYVRTYTKMQRDQMNTM